MGIGRVRVSLQSRGLEIEAADPGSGNCYECRESGHWQRECTAKITKISNTLYNLLPCTVCKYLTKGRGHKIRKSACQSFDT